MGVGVGEESRTPQRGWEQLQQRQLPVSQAWDLAAPSLLGGLCRKHFSLTQPSRTRLEEEQSSSTVVEGGAVGAIGRGDDRRGDAGLGGVCIYLPADNFSRKLGCSRRAARAEGGAGLPDTAMGR